MRWVPLPLDSRAALLPPFPICLLARLPDLAPPPPPYSPQRRRRRIEGLAAASAPPCGLRRWCRRAIRRGVRWSGFDSSARGGEADLCRAIRRGFWAGLWGFCMEFCCEMVCRRMEFGG
jgi:hypothetical protein